jgi:putative ABC transport system permease protein
MDSLARHLAQAYPATNKNIGVHVIGDAAYRLRQWKRPSILLGAIVVVVLLIACANVAALLMARGESRRTEVAIRQALGAGRLRLLRQWITESMLLALMGGMVSFFLSSWLIDLLPTLFPPQLGSVTWGVDFRLDTRVLIFILFMCVITVLLFGLAPALRAYKAELVPSLKGDPSLGNIPRRFSAHDVLVVGQVALSTAVLLVAGLLFRSFVNTLRVDPGFDKENRLLVFLAPHQAMSLYRSLSERFHGQPWVRNFSFASRVPLWPTAGGLRVMVYIPGIQLPSGEDAPKIKYTSIGPNYFRAMGTRILEGRDFTDLDHVATARAVLVNETMARRFWPNENPIGKVFRTGTTNSVAHEIVGVVQDGKYSSVRENPEPYIFFPFAVKPLGEVELIVETNMDPRGAIDLFKQELRRVDKNIPIMSVTTLKELLRSLLYEDELGAELVGILAAVGLILTGVGVYGVVAFAVSRRTREIGIRKALGAQQSDILRHVLTRGLWLAFVGCSLGMVISLGVSRLLSRLLFGVSATDPANFVGVVVLLFSVVFLASYFPARRASQVDPMMALRYE